LLIFLWLLPGHSKSDTSAKVKGNPEYQEFAHGIMCYWPHEWVGVKVHSCGGAGPWSSLKQFKM